MATLDFDQKFLGRIAKQTEDSNPFLSDALYQILGLSVLLARRLVRARKLRKLDTSRDTPSLSAYQHILWMSREGLSILELFVLPYAQDNQHGPECRVLSVKLRASFYFIFCLFHNSPPVMATNIASTSPRAPGAPPLPLSPRGGNGGRKADPPGLSPSSKRAGKQPTLREPISSIVSETSFVTNPYAGGPVGTPSPGPPITAPPGLHPVPIPQPSSFLLPPLNFVPLASQHFSTAMDYSHRYLNGAHPLRLSVALEHAAFLWDCVHDHEGSRRVARKAIKEVYRAQEPMDDREFEDASELVRLLGTMMKRKSFESTPPVGMSGPEQTESTARAQSSGGAVVGTQRTPQISRKAAEGPPISVPATQTQSSNAVRSRATSASKTSPKEKDVGTPRSGRDNSQESTPRAKHISMESGTSTTPRAPQGAGGRSPATPSKIRSIHPATAQKTTPVIGSSTPIAPGAAATIASNTVRRSPNLRRSPPMRSPPPQKDRQR